MCDKYNLGYNKAQLSKKRKRGDTKNPIDITIKSSNVNELIGENSLLFVYNEMVCLCLWTKHRPKERRGE